MAKYKRATSTIDVTGLSIKDIMNIDLETFNKLSESDLRRLTSRLVSASNKRIRALEKANIISPAYRGLGTDTTFSTKLDSTLSHKQKRNKLAEEFARARRFLGAKTSTIRGYNAMVKKNDIKLAKALDVPLKEIKTLDKKRAFEILHKLQESGYVPKGFNDESSLASKKARQYIFKQLRDNPEIDNDTLMTLTSKNYDKEELIEQETEETEL